jgi:hypothetical protein
MKLVGDEKGIDALNAMRAKRPAYLKFLITEARTSTLAFVEFLSDDGVKFMLKWRGRTGELIVTRLPNQ